MLSLYFSRASRSASSSATGSACAQTSSSLTSEDGQTGYGRFTGLSSKTSSSECSVLVSQLPEVKRMVVLTALKKLLNNDNFYITDLRKIAELVGVPDSGPAWQLLSPLSCVKYHDMPKELRDAIPHLINECLTASERVHADVGTALKGVDL
jgi:hypothetical protein